MTKQARVGSIETIGCSVPPSTRRIVGEALRYVGAVFVACIFFYVAFVD